MSDWKRILEQLPDEKREKRKFETTEVNIVKPKRRPYFGLNPVLVWSCVGSLALCVLVFIIWVAMTAAEVRQWDESGKIYPGVTVFDIDVGGMTTEEARYTIEAYSDNYFSGKQLKICCGSESVTVSVKDAMTTVDAGYIAGLAYSYGRTEGLFARARLINRNSVRPLEFSSGFTINEEYVAQMTEALASLVEKEFENYQVTNTGTSLEITRGQNGLAINRTEVAEKIHMALSTGNFEDITVEAVVQEAVPPDIDYLRSTVYVEPQNAYVERTGTKRYVVHDEVVGVDIDTERIKADMQSDDWDFKEYEFIYTYPTSVSELKEILFMDTLASCTTELSSAASAKAVNIKLAAKEVSGAILLPKSEGTPGEEFSFNDVVGERSESLGYQAVSSFADGETVDGIGGGICQLASTIYVAALKAQLEITERHSHVFPVGYVPLGEDATVQWGQLDFRFRNSTEYPIKILAEVSGTKLTVTILGTDIDPDTETTLDSVKTGEKDYETEYRYNSSLPYGTYRQKQAGQKGYTCELYMNVYRKGEFVERILVNNTEYSAANQIIEANPVPEDKN